VGKLGVPDSILNKPDRLDDTEQERMRSHPEVGMRIVGGIELFKPAIPYVIAHHERYDGNGYPEGLKGEDIPIEGRLLAVVDTLDAILSDRPYRKGAPLRQALAELWENRGTQFDPKIVDILFRLIREGQVDFSALYEREEDIACVDEIMAPEKAPV
jgi:HD-GYP domain-containing protein (c-di-GMP phosphodiesterase class II)